MHPSVIQLWRSRSDPKQLRGRVEAVDVIFNSRIPRPVTRRLCSSLSTSSVRTCHAWSSLKKVIRCRLLNALGINPKDPQRRDSLKRPNRDKIWRRSFSRLRGGEAKAASRLDLFLTFAKRQTRHLAGATANAPSLLECRWPTPQALKYLVADPSPGLP